MDDNQQYYWEQIYTDKDRQFPIYDGWLDNHLSYLSAKKRIVDLGCGNGVNALALAQNSIGCIACDSSAHALEQLIGIMPDALTLQFDMSKGLPFLHDSVDVIIADLSLHYFPYETTCSIISDIKRVLKPAGRIFCRMNAYDPEMDYSQYEQLEKDYYIVNQCARRFFTMDTTKAFFSDWKITKLVPSSTQKYGSKKHVIVCEAEKC